MLKKPFKKLIAFSFSVLALSFVYEQPAQADSADYWLPWIALYTHDTVDRLNNLPTYIQQSVLFMLSWTNEDKSDETNQFRDNFISMEDARKKLIPAEEGSQQWLLNDLFYKDASDNSRDTSYLQNLNYGVLQGQKYIPKKPPTDEENKKYPYYSSYAYVRFASGMNISHIIPGAKGINWTSGNALKDYANYFNSVSAIQTFNGYMLSRLLAESAYENPLTKAQTQLIEKATSPTWFKAIAGENVGYVLRQILLFNSQMYVLLTRLLQTQQEILTAQTMNNTLLILLNKQNETLLLNKATGAMPA